MARSRMIKPEFWDDEKLAKCSRDARLTFIGMWNQSDDFGVVKGNLKWLMNKIFPYDEISTKKFQNWIEELEKCGFIFKFNSNGENYFNIVSFLKHQKVEKPSKTRNPEAPTPRLLPDELPTTPLPLPDEDNRSIKGSKEEIEVKGITPDGVPPSSDFIGDLIQDFTNHYLNINKIAYKVIDGKERKSMGGILAYYKQQKPGADTGTARDDLNRVFKAVLSTDFKNEFLNGVTISRLNSHFNEYYLALKGKKGNDITIHDLS